MSVRVKLHNELATTAAPTVEDGINPKPVWAIRFSWLFAALPDPHNDRFVYH
jgi:hypothetical protein